MVIGFSDTVLVWGSTVHTAGWPPSLETALHGMTTSLQGWNRPSPMTAAPRVIAAGGCLDTDLDPDGSAGRVHGRRDLANGALCFHIRIGHQRQLDGGLAGFVGEDRLVDVEHRVARAVLGDRENALCHLYDLPRLGIAGGNDAGNARPQDGVRKLVAGGAKLGLCRIERGLGRAVGFLGLVMFPFGREALGEQGLLAFVGGCRLAEHGLGGLDGGLGRGHRRLLLLWVESGQHLVGRHVVADVNCALDDPAADPKG